MEGTYEYSSWVLLGLIIYMAGMLAVGWYASKRIKNTTDYVVAGRRLGIFFCTGSLFATWFGAATCMGAAGNAYLYGNQGIIFDPWGAALCLGLLGLFFARLVRRGKYITTVDLFENRYGKHMGFWAAIILSIADMGWLASLLVGFGTVLQFFAGIPLTTGIVISTIIVVIYTYWGGMWAVSMTDAIQMVILVGGLILMFAVVLPLGGGLDYLFANDPSHNATGFFQWNFFPTEATSENIENGSAGFFFYTGMNGWFYWLASIMAIGVGTLPAQSLMQRALSAKDEKTAVRSSYLSGLLYISVGMIPVLLGMIYFKLNPNLTADQASSIILLNIAVEYMNPVFAVVFVCALVAAIMSSSDSTILSSSSLLGYNVTKLIKPDTSEEKLFKITKLLVPVVGCFALIIALYFQEIYDLMVVTGTVILVGLLAPYAGAYFWKKANKTGALASFYGGTVTWIAGYILHHPMTSAMNTIDGVVDETFAMWDALYLSSVYALIVSIVLLVVVSLATQKSCRPIPLKDIDGNELKKENWIGSLMDIKDPESKKVDLVNTP